MIDKKEQENISHPCATNCEWNPKENRAAFENEEFHGFAEVIVGSTGNYFLCKQCSELPQFKRFKKRNIEYK